MSVFGGFDEGICADLFGDEYGLAMPLRPIFRAKNSKPEAMEIQKNQNLASKNKNVVGNYNISSPRGYAALRFDPALDGLRSFETLVYH